MAAGGREPGELELDRRWVHAERVAAHGFLDARRDGQPDPVLVGDDGETARIAPRVLHQGREVLRVAREHEVVHRAGVVHDPRAQAGGPQVPELVGHPVDELGPCGRFQGEVGLPERSLERAVAERSRQQGIPAVPGLGVALDQPRQQARLAQPDVDDRLRRRRVPHLVAPDPVVHRVREDDDAARRELGLHDERLVLAVAQARGEPDALALDVLRAEHLGGPESVHHGVRDHVGVHGGAPEHAAGNVGAPGEALHLAEHHVRLEGVRGVGHLLQGGRREQVVGVEEEQVPARRRLDPRVPRGCRRPAGRLGEDLHPGVLALQPSQDRQGVVGRAVVDGDDLDLLGRQRLGERRADGLLDGVGGVVHRHDDGHARRCRHGRGRRLRRRCDDLRGAVPAEAHQQRERGAGPVGRRRDPPQAGRRRHGDVQDGVVALGHHGEPAGGRGRAGTATHLAQHPVGERDVRRLQLDGAAPDGVAPAGGEDADALHGDGDPDRGPPALAGRGVDPGRGGAQPPAVDEGARLDARLEAQRAVLVAAREVRHRADDRGPCRDLVLVLHQDRVEVSPGGGLGAHVPGAAVLLRKLARVEAGLGAHPDGHAVVVAGDRDEDGGAAGGQVVGGASRARPRQEAAGQPVGDVVGARPAHRPLRPVLVHPTGGAAQVQHAVDPHRAVDGRPRLVAALVPVLSVHWAPREGIGAARRQGWRAVAVVPSRSCFLLLVPARSGGVRYPLGGGDRRWMLPRRSTSRAIFPYGKSSFRHPRRRASERR
ncbi:hypothetical protein ISCU110981_12965 [Isoptericola cucumis]